MSSCGNSPPPSRPVTPESPTGRVPPRKRGARISVPPIRNPGVDPALIDWAHRLQAQGFAPELPNRSDDPDTAIEEVGYDPDRVYDPFRGWQHEPPVVDDEHDEPEQVVPVNDDGYEADDEAEEEDPEEDPVADNFWEAGPAPDEDAGAVADLFPGAPEVPGHPFPGPPGQNQAVQIPEPEPDFPPDTDLGEIINPDPEEVLTVDAVMAQRNALMAQQGTDWVRIQELENHLVHMRRQRDVAVQQWTEERARVGRAQQVAAISGQAVRRMTVRMEEGATVAARETNLTDQEIQEHLEHVHRTGTDLRYRARQKAPIRDDWGEGTSRQGGQG